MAALSGMTLAGDAYGCGFSTIGDDAGGRNYGADPYHENGDGSISVTEIIGYGYHLADQERFDGESPDGAGIGTVLGQSDLAATGRVVPEAVPFPEPAAWSTVEYDY